MKRFLAICVFLSAPSAWSAPTVSVASVAELQFYPTLSAPAEVISANNASLSAEISAAVTHITVEVGDRVVQGDTLVTLDCRTYQAQLASQMSMLSELRAQRALASDQYERAQRLQAQGNLGDDALQQRETALVGMDARLEMQQTQIDLASISVDRCEVKAPFSGVVSARAAQLGALATPGTPLVQLVQITDAELEAKIAPGRTLPDAGLTFVSDHQRYPVELRAALPIVDVRERTQVFRLTFPDESPLIGATGRLEWQLPKPHIASDLLVRRQVNRDWQLGVLVEEQGEARFQVIEGAIEGQPAVIDLPPSMRIITQGRLLAVEGAAVEVRN